MLNIKKLLTKILTMLNDLNSNNIKTKEISLSKSVTLNSHTGTTVFDSYDLSSQVGSGHTIKAAIFEWANGSGCYAGNIAITNNKLTLSLFNGSNVTLSITSIRLLLFYV